MNQTCPYEGCRATGGWTWMRDYHAPSPHVRCSCGWVGTTRGHGNHVAWKVRRGNETTVRAQHIPTSIPAPEG